MEEKYASTFPLIPGKQTTVACLSRILDSKPKNVKINVIDSDLSILLYSCLVRINSYEPNQRKTYNLTIFQNEKKEMGIKYMNNTNQMNNYVFISSNSKLLQVNKKIFIILSVFYKNFLNNLLNIHFFLNYHFYDLSYNCQLLNILFLKIFIIQIFILFFRN